MAKELTGNPRIDLKDMIIPYKADELLGLFMEYGAGEFKSFEEYTRALKFIAHVLVFSCNDNREEAVNERKAVIKRFNKRAEAMEKEAFTEVETIETLDQLKEKIEELKKLIIEN